MDTQLQPVGVIIGRFQVDDIHQGHVLLMEYVKQRHKSVLVLLGIRRSPASSLNPLNYHLREQMLRQYLPDAVIMPLYDTRSDQTWSRGVDLAIETAFPNREAVLYAGREGFIPHYKGRFPPMELHLGGDDSGTRIRQDIAQLPRNTPDFRAGVIHALMTLGPRVYPTVDIAVWRRWGEGSPSTSQLCPQCKRGVNYWTGPDESPCACTGSIQVLFGKKAEEVAWRFPGGFVDLKDPSLEQAARRELYEETGLTCEGGLEYIASIVIDDWRNRDIPDVQILTSLFLMPYSHGGAQAGDDIAAVQWQYVFNDFPIVADHKPLLDAVRNHFKEHP